MRSPPAFSTAIGIGHDTDRVAAIAGALLGARWGASAIPAHWRRVGGPATGVGRMPRGVTLQQADCLIAATAAAHRAVLATANPKDFPMQGLEVQHWPVGH